MAQPAKFDKLRQHVVVKNSCAISNNGFCGCKYTIFFELGEGFEPSNVGFADRYVHHFATRAFAEAERIELPAVVLETTMLPLHHAPVRTPCVTEGTRTLDFRNHNPAL